MKRTPPLAAGAADALDRLRDEQRQIDELLARCAQPEHGPPDGVMPPPSALDRARMTSLAFTLLRVHDGLESRLLEPALAQAAGPTHPVLARAATRRAAVRQAMEGVEALSPRDARHTEARVRAMAVLMQAVRAWFDFDENQLFGLAREMAQGGRIDLSALDHELAARQEALLSAGRAR